MKTSADPQLTAMVTIMMIVIVFIMILIVMKPVILRGVLIINIIDDDKGSISPRAPGSQEYVYNIFNWFSRALSQMSCNSNIFAVIRHSVSGGKCHICANTFVCF